MYYKDVLAAVVRNTDMLCSQGSEDADTNESGSPAVKINWIQPTG